MKDPLDLTPIQAREIIARHEQVALSILATMGSTPNESIDNLNIFIRNMSDVLVSNDSAYADITHDDRRRIAGLLNMAVCPMMIAQWKSMMRNRNTQTENDNGKPLA